MSEARADLGRDVRRMLLIVTASGVFYAIVYLAQRDIQANGLPGSIAGVLVEGTPASRADLLRQCAAYYGGTFSLFALYAWLLALGRRWRSWPGWLRTLVLLTPVLFHLALLPGRPSLSVDAYTYIAFGYLGISPGGNPYTQVVSAVVHTPLGQQLVALGWRPAPWLTPYGPLWTWYTTTILRLTGDVTVALLLLKSLVVASSLGSAALIWAVLGRVRPTDQPLGTLGYLWNPLVILEFAAEGHNDALMLACVLTALLLALRMQLGWGLLALGMGILTKYLPLLLLPSYLAYCYHTVRFRKVLVSRLVLSSLAGLGLAILLYRPYWSGAATFAGLLQETGLGATPTITGALIWVGPRLSLPAWAVDVARRVPSALFALYLLHASWRVRDAASWLAACGGIALVYVLLASPEFWPWYATVPLALMALTPRGLFRWMVLVLPCCARLVAPLDVMALNGWISSSLRITLTLVLGVALPLVVLLTLTTGQRWYKRPGRPVF